jgi:carbamoyltransferase
VTGVSELALAGGVGLNCVMNARLRDSGPFDHVWVQPAAGDSGTALGAALWIDGRMREFPNTRQYGMENVFLGPAYNNSEIEQALQRFKIGYRRLENVAEETADLLADDLIVGWFQGRMEYGPRALGGRSILGSPRSHTMQERMNELKDREDFRPVAPAVIEERAADWFCSAQPSPFMLFVFEVLPHKASLIPAVCHVDGTARIQTVSRDNDPTYYDLLRAFERRTGIPMLVNTSFNTRGEPIVCTPSDAIRTFWTSPLDALVIGSFLVEKHRREDGRQSV